MLKACIGWAIIAATVLAILCGLFLAMGWSDFPIFIGVSAGVVFLNCIAIQWIWEQGNE